MVHLRPAVDEVTRLDEAPGAPDRADGAEDPRPPEAPPAEAPDAGHGLSLAALPPLLELLSNGSEVGRNIAKEVLEVLASMLGCTVEERAMMGLDRSSRGGGGAHVTNAGQEGGTKKALSDMWVDFLVSEAERPGSLEK